MDDWPGIWLRDRVEYFLVRLGEMTPIWRKFPVTFAEKTEYDIVAATGKAVVLFLR